MKTDLHPFAIIFCSLKTAVQVQTLVVLGSPDSSIYQSLINDFGEKPLGSFEERLAVLRYIAIAAI